MRAISTLKDAEKVINQLQDQLDALRTQDINLNGRKIINGGLAIKPNDLITIQQVKDLIAAAK